MDAEFESELVLEELSDELLLPGLFACFFVEENREQRWLQELDDEE